MIIESKAQASTKNIPIEQLVNRIGKYLSKTLDGVYNYKKNVQTFDLYTVVYYQYPIMPSRPGGEKRYSDLEEMRLNISLTSYSNKIRVNLIEISPEEQTLKHFVLREKDTIELVVAREKIESEIRKTLNKVFEGYIFIY